MANLKFAALIYHSRNGSNFIFADNPRSLLLEVCTIFSSYIQQAFSRDEGHQTLLSVLAEQTGFPADFQKLDSNQYLTQFVFILGHLFSGDDDVHIRNDAFSLIIKKDGEITESLVYYEKSPSKIHDCVNYFCAYIVPVDKNDKGIAGTSVFAKPFPSLHGNGMQYTACPSHAYQPVENGSEFGLSFAIEKSAQFIETELALMDIKPDHHIRGLLEPTLSCPGGDSKIEVETNKGILLVKTHNDRISPKTTVECGLKSNPRSEIVVCGRQVIVPNR